MSHFDCLFHLFVLSSLSRITKASLPSPCSWLEGTLTLAKEDSVKKCDSLPFQYVLLDASPKKANGSTTTTTSATTTGSAPSDTVKDAAATKSKFDEYKESLRDFLNNSIAKLEPVNAEDVYKTLTKDYPDYCQAHMSMIQNLEANASVKVQHPFLLRKELLKEGKAEDVQSLERTCQRVIELANVILKGINLDDLLCYYGLKADFRPDAAKTKVQMDKLKVLLIEAYVKKVVALGKLGVIAATRAEAAASEDDAAAAEAKAALKKQVNAVYVEASKVIDMSDARVLAINVWHAYTNQHWGRFGKNLTKLYEEKQQKDVLLELKTMFETELKWEHLTRFLDKQIVTANPQSYRLF